MIDSVPRKVIGEKVIELLTCVGWCGEGSVLTQGTGGAAQSIHELNPCGMVILHLSRSIFRV